MNKLTYKDIVIGKEYVITHEDMDYDVGEVVTAIGREKGAYHNDGDSHGFVGENKGWQYISYENIKEKDMKQDYTVGDLFKVIESNGWIYEGAIVKLKMDDGSASPYFELVTGDSKNAEGAYILYSRLEPLFIQEVEPAPEVFKPFTLTVDTLEDFEVLKGIMHLHNKVSGSSFFKMDWTPEPHKVKAFMMDVADRISTHREGWSKYNKGE